MSRTGALILLFLGAALGARMWLVFTAPPSPLLFAAGRMAVVEGTVADDPDRRDTSVRVPVEVATLNGKPAEGKMLVVLPAGTDLQYGDTITARGLLEEPQTFQTATGRTFDYAGYLKARGIEAVMQRAVLRSSTEGSPGVLRTLFVLKHTFERALESVMQAPQAALMEGFLLGEKHGLSAALTQAFVVVGLIHVIVLSGYNIGVVSEWTLRAFSLFLRRRAALVATAIIIVLFALMAGGGMATARAAIMGLIAIVARYLRRPALALRGLGAAVLAMLLWNPLVVFDVGFVLSVLATLGLITLSPYVETKLRLLPAGDIRSVAATTIAVQMFVLPALLYYTGVLSFVSIPVNIIVLPLVPLAMLLGFAAGMLALLHPYPALLPALFGDVLLRAMIWLATSAAALPFAATTVAAFPAWLALLCYAPLTYWAILLHSQTAVQSPAN